MTAAIQPADLGFFSTLASAASLSAAARELGVTTPAVSKHLAQMEARVGVLLVNRSTRRMSLTPEGEIYLEHARRILAEIDGMGELLGLAKATPQGLLRVNATLGFGRSHIAPLISRFVRRHPGVQVQLQLSVSPPPVDRRPVRRLRALRRAAGQPRHRAQHRRQPPAAVRITGLPGAARHAQGAERPHAAQLHRHPPG
jgi:DNA-binding transcriptional LysR family regulator